MRETVSFSEENGNGTEPTDPTEPTEPTNRTMGSPRRRRSQDDVTMIVLAAALHVQG